MPKSRQLREVNCQGKKAMGQMLCFQNWNIHGPSSIVSLHQMMVRITYPWVPLGHLKSLVKSGPIYTPWSISNNTPVSSRYQKLHRPTWNQDPLQETGVECSSLHQKYFLALQAWQIQLGSFHSTEVVRVEHNLMRKYSPRLMTSFYILDGRIEPTALLITWCTAKPEWKSTIYITK